MCLTGKTPQKEKTDNYLRPLVKSWTDTHNFFETEMDLQVKYKTREHLCY